jgi:hypothetical protein
MIIMCILQRYTQASSLFKELHWLDIVAQACNPSYLGGRDQEDHSLRSAQVKKEKKRSSQDPISTNGWTQWYTPIITATWGSTNTKIAV